MNLINKLIFIVGGAILSLAVQAAPAPTSVNVTQYMIGPIPEDGMELGKTVYVSWVPGGQVHAYLSFELQVSDDGGNQWQTLASNTKSINYITKPALPKTTKTPIVKNTNKQLKRNFLD